jgi:shikimate kinase
MKIVLIGYRAAGKTTLGKLLSKRLGWPYLDVDRGIERRSGRTITQLYRERGDAHYRDVEGRVVADMCREDECVVAFGAGSLMREESRTAARKRAFVVYMQAPVEELWRRMEADPRSSDTRPNLSSGGIEEVAEMLARREPVYIECADLILDAMLPPEQLVEAVVTAFTSKLKQRVER